MDPESFLPLPRPTLHILIALSDARTSGKIRLSPGTLYAAIKRLLEDGLIAEMRRRYYRLTKLVRSVVLAQLERWNKR